MAVHQSGKNIVVSYKAQSALGTPATGAGGLGLNIAPSPGLRLMKALINDPTVRRDGQTLRGRHGSRKVDGSYSVALRKGELDTLIAAFMRSSWTAAAVRTYDNSAGLTSLEVTGVNQITQVGTTTLLGVVAKGDLIKLGGMSTAANNDVWVRVVNVTATVITTVGSALTIQAADTACTLTVAKKLYSAATPAEAYFTFDEYNQDIDISMQFTDVKVSRLKMTARPNELVMFELGLVGLDGQPLATGASPSLTSPTFVSAALGMTLADGTINVNGTDYADLTSLEFELNANAQVPDVLGSATGPDVFMGNAVGTGSVSGVRVDGANLNAFDNETRLAIFAHMKEPESNPADFFSCYIGNAIYNGNDGPLGGDGPLVETIPFVFGKDEDGNPSDATMIKFATSAA